MTMAFRGWCGSILVGAMVLGCGSDDAADGGLGGGGTGASAGAGASGGSGAVAGGGSGGAGAVGGGGTGGSLPLGSTVTSVVVTPVADASAAGQVLTFGQAFQPGDVAQSVGVADGETSLPTQVDVKRTHPDGSVRHAVISVELPALASGAERTLDLKTVADSASAGLSAADAVSEGFDTVVELTIGGVTYSASAAALLTGGNPTKWLDGSLATEFQVRGPLLDGSTAHPALEVIFGIRFYSKTKARVSVVIENALHDTPGNLTYDVAVKAEGKTVFEKSGVDHFHHARWRHVFQYGDDVTAVHTRPDLAYLIGTGAIPKYDLARTLTAESVKKEWTDWQSSPHDIMDPGIVTVYMPQTGGRGDIGPLPRWAAVSLMSGDANAAAVTNGVGDLSGSWSVHYRDRGTGRAISIDDYPKISLNPQASGAFELPECTNCDSPYREDTSHQPSLAFVPYLLTGDFYYLEELYFWTSWNFIHQNHAYREEATGLLQSLSVRAQAWTIRKLAHTAWIAPDDHPEKAYYEEKLDNNFAWYQQNAVDSHPLGAWGRQSNLPNGGRPDDNMASDVHYYTSPWMHDFLVWTWDYTARLGYAKAEPIRDWFAKYVTGRFTSSPDFNPFDGAPYHLAVEGAPTGGQMTGPLFTTWADVYAKSFANRTEPAPTTLAGNCSFCYPAIARVALAAAIHGGLPKAQEGFDFLDGELRMNDEPYDKDPTWAIVP